MDFDLFTDSLKAKTSFPIVLNTYSCDFVQPKTNFPWGSADHIFLLTLSGKGKFEINGNNCTLSKGKLIFCKKGIPCSYIPITSDWHTCFITFNGDGADQLIKYYGFRDANLFDDEFINDLLMNICINAKQNINNDKISELLYKFINETGHSLLDVFRPKPLIKALRYINNNYTRANLTIEEIIKASGTSGTSLYKMFKQMEHLSPAQFLINMRMNHAKKLLLTTRDMVNDIAKTVGYETANYFSSAFKEHVGMSPLSFRKRYFGRTLEDVNNELRKGPTDKEYLEIIKSFNSTEEISKYIKNKYNLDMDEPL